MMNYKDISNAEISASIKESSCIKSTRAQIGSLIQCISQVTADYIFINMLLIIHAKPPAFHVIADSTLMTFRSRQSHLKFRLIIYEIPLAHLDSLHHCSHQCCHHKTSQLTASPSNMILFLYFHTDHMIT